MTLLGALLALSFMLQLREDSSDQLLDLLNGGSVLNRGQHVVQVSELVLVVLALPADLLQEGERNLVALLDEVLLLALELGEVGVGLGLGAVVLFVVHVS